MDKDKLRQQLADPITRDLFLHFTQKVETAVGDLIKRIAEAHDEPSRPYRQIIIGKLAMRFISFAAESAHSINMPKWVWDSMCNEIWSSVEAVKSEYIAEEERSQ